MGWTLTSPGQKVTTAELYHSNISTAFGILSEQTYLCIPYNICVCALKTQNFTRFNWRNKDSVKRD